ncbi:MAG: enoyl-CoA hydratase-related protein, partial [Pseudomonadota bacterium]
LSSMPAHTACRRAASQRPYRIEGPAPRLPNARCKTVPQLAARWVDAELALQYGMAAAMLPDDKLYARALTTAQEIAQWPMNSLREIKRSLRAHHLDNVDKAINLEQAAMARQVGSPENIEAITAFLEKRAPDFSKP